MSSEPTYVVTSAVLINMEGGSRWKITFTPKGDASAAPAEQALVPPERIDYLFFDTTYMLEQIRGLQDGT